jgi:dTDP-glucose 4,6-dehydratase
MTTALIAGAAGLVGSALCRHLMAQGTAVIAVDNLCTGSMENLAELQTNPLFQWLEQDICQPFTVTESLDYIYHMASPASPDDFDAMALDIIWVNTVGTRNLLDLAKTHNAKLLFASTSEVYGNPLVHPQVESYWATSTPMANAVVMTKANAWVKVLSAITVACMAFVILWHAFLIPMAPACVPRMAVLSPISCYKPFANSL